MDAVTNGQQQVETQDTSPWKGFQDDMVMSCCVPVLNKYFRIFREPSGLERLYDVNTNNEATLLLDQQPMRVALHHSLKHQFGSIPPDGILTAAIKLWRKEVVPIIEEPAPFCFVGDDRLCFKRFDWLPTQGNFPAWEEFLCRLSDADAFKAFVWSSFEPKNRSRQYCWLHGSEGEDGKTAVLGVIVKVFGNAAAGVSNSHVGKNANQFVYSMIYGKRIVVYADCKNPNFGMSEFVRNVTSGDPVQIEFKGETGFSAPLYCKLFVGSNPQPTIGSENADQSRLILIRVAPSKNRDDPEWPTRLEAELPAFLWACQESYVRLCPNHGKIRISAASEELKKSIAAEAEEQFADVFEKYFVAQPGGRLSASMMTLVLTRYAGFTARDSIRLGDFKSWMKRTHNVEYKNSNSDRRYEGVVIKPEMAEHLKLLERHSLHSVQVPVHGNPLGSAG
jgi:putative DNA primase/helicase